MKTLTLVSLLCLAASCSRGGSDTETDRSESPDHQQKSGNDSIVGIELKAQDGLPGLEIAVEPTPKTDASVFVNALTTQIAGLRAACLGDLKLHAVLQFVLNVHDGVVFSTTGESADDACLNQAMTGKRVSPAAGPPNYRLLVQLRVSNENAEDD